jgi:hypothetical protein
MTPGAPRELQPPDPPAAAPEPKTNTNAPLPRTADGHPKLSGYWVAGMPGRRKGGGGPPKPSAAGAAAAKNYDQRFDNPAIKCSPGNILMAWTHDRHVNEIRQSGNTITLQYGYMDLKRTIHMGASHPQKIEPTLAGHSIGRWDGDVLVVDTVGFAPGVLSPFEGLMHSDQLHVVERFSLDAAGVLTREFTVEDPKYLQAPYGGSDVMTASKQPYEPYDCVELSGKNNERPGQAK